MAASVQSAGDRAESASDALERAGLRYVQRVALADALASAVDVPEQRGPGKVRLAQWVVEGRRLDVTRPRDQPAAWSAEPAAWSTRLLGCSRRWAAHGDGSLRPVGCGLSICPSCRARAAGSRIRRAAVMLEAMQEAGACVALLTFTQPQGAPVSGPVVLRDAELGSWWVPQLAKRRGRATAGADLADELERLTRAWRRLRHDSRPARAWWAGHVEACWTGMEWTTGTPMHGPLSDGAWRPKVPRYHVHLHAVVALGGARWRWNDDGSAVDDDGSPWSELRAAWCRLSPGAAPAAQDLRRVDDLEGGLAEVLKYPFKPSESTVATTLEAVSVTRGLHPHQTSGAWHGGSKRWKEAAFLALNVAGGHAIELDEGDHLARSLVAAVTARDEHLLRPPSPALYRPGGGGPWRGAEEDAPWGPWGEARAAVPVSIAWLRDVEPGRVVDVALYDPRWRAWGPTVQILPALALELAAAAIAPTVADAGPLELEPEPTRKQTRRNRPVTDDIHPTNPETLMPPGWSRPSPGDDRL